jgi:AA9 family protein
VDLFSFRALLKTHYSYPAFDPRLDFDFPGIKRITWTSPKASNLNGTGPVENVASPDIACRNGPLIPPTINAVARAGSNMSIQWTPWFISHKGPVLTVSDFGL